jgi:hypothetical protein
VSEGKSPRKSPLRGVAADKTLRGPGRGPAPGAPNAGRPPSEVKKALVEGFAASLPELLRLAREADSASDRIRAIDVLGKYAGLQSIELEVSRPVALVIEGL